MFVRSGFPFNYDTNDAGDESGLNFMVVDVETGEIVKEASRAQQQFAEEADINTIVRRFGLSGQLPTGVRMPSYADFESVYDFKSAMDAVSEAREAFAALPPDLRYKFHNDPQEFVAFCSDDANLEEARKMGLVPPAEQPSPAEPAAVISAEPKAHGST
uniref:Minor capsid protein n=1 Tax=Gokushovirinae environmental samples TaxID=1478972 RepID=A0A2R3UAA9_9VIRU|nr:minor capsid protein [Gokushovirinae environmental samples]